MYKKLTVVLLCACLLISLSGCENGKINEAKECVDIIYEKTLEIAELENKLENLTDSDNSMTLRIQIDLCEKKIDSATRAFEKIYEELSENGRKKVDEYIEEAASRELDKIWND